MIDNNEIINIGWEGGLLFSIFEKEVFTKIYEAGFL